MSDWICRNICFLAPHLEYLQWVKETTGKTHSQTIRDLINEDRRNNLEYQKKQGNNKHS